MLYISIVKNMTFAIQSKTYQMDKPRFFKAETLKENFFLRGRISLSCVLLTDKSRSSAQLILKTITLHLIFTFILH